MSYGFGAGRANLFRLLVNNVSIGPKLALAVLQDGAPGNTTVVNSE
jgi:Holliday junction resolvasome RuvABC DNA-binding subunit